MAIFKISDSDIKRYQNLTKDNKSHVAVRKFINKYLLPASRTFQSNLSKVMRRAEEILSPKQLEEISLTISSKTAELQRGMQSLYSQFVTKVYANGIFNDFSITNKSVRQTVVKNTLEIFNDSTNKALFGASDSSKRAIRSIQEDLLISSKKVKGILKRGLPENEISKLQAILKRDIEKANPEFYKMVDDQQFIQYKNGSLHRIDDYTNMATRTTLLNTDRAASEINEGVLGNRVVEYYTRDPRAVKVPRQICIHTLRQKLFGKSLVATDSNAAAILGIPYIANIKAQDAMGVNCRHSVRNAGAQVNNQVNKILYLSEVEAV